MRYYLKVYLKQLLIRLGLRRATLGDALDKLIQHRDLKEDA